MTSSSVPLRSIYRKGFAVSSSYSIFGKWATGSCPSSSCFFPGGAHQLSTVSGAVISPPSRLQNSSPWLMLPPAFEGVKNTMSYKFYSLAENKVLTLSGSGDKEVTDSMQNRNLRFRGSSCGWIALLNRHNLDLFLYNPISRRHLKLPSIQNLPNFPEHYPRDVTKVILSCSPDEDEENCRAVIIYGCLNSLAFCCPGRSKLWTPIGEMRWWDAPRFRILSRGYRDCVYSARQNVYFGLTNLGELESWDLQDPSSPQVINMMKVEDNIYFEFFDKHKCLNLRELQPKELCRPAKHLVVADEDLLLVTQYIMEHVGPNGLPVDCLDEGSQNCPYKTIDFDIHKYDPMEGDLKYVHGSWLGGLALFIGFHSHSVAFPVSQFPELKPNSIYFTDVVRKESLSNRDNDELFGGHDIGIFNYEEDLDNFNYKDDTVSPCYYPCDLQSIKRIMPPPMWFFPS